MLKMKKMTAVALAVGAFFSVSALQAAQSENTLAKDPSYALGVLVGMDLKGMTEAQQEVIKYDQEKLLAGVADGLKGKADLSKDKQLVETLQGVDEKLKAASLAKAAEQAKQAQEDGAKLTAEFNKKSGVKKTDSGLLYRIDKAGEGENIKATDKVKVHYTGKLPNGKVFDSSRQRNLPAEFRLDQVIPGWSEGLQLVKKGGKIELVIPPKLAYGEQEMGEIPANSTLYFEVEVLDVMPQAKK
ncbi:FKBP-type peptidyl-prolyl cis-trans isomerase FkpA [Mesocricetibacter intestinalis]|uniref:Peptidyl-prolyl cis-trans isomerase n=1 Tax=Mesocricetibacter intestinalis TaxID=1521930 RepID=A0A4R6V823_9PAST|nr:FKBP-type peptidyl-prolyl cis-trans isomerase [Mesocricetibacter intestinalis]TDQ57582.1 FKBP-type peptidyl-prolyl cis-trans isomerase FkpA [Mesocricetibacter intestinalis]